MVVSLARCGVPWAEPLVSGIGTSAECEDPVACGVGADCAVDP